jgi:hypothetical protein
MGEILMDYVNKLINKEIHEDDIYDFINNWHSKINNPNNLELHEYLGLTWEEYSLWVKCEKSIINILNNRKVNIMAVDLDMSFSIHKEKEYYHKVEISPDFPDVIDISYIEVSDKKLEKDKRTTITLDLEQSEKMVIALNNLISWIKTNKKD